MAIKAVVFDVGKVVLGESGAKAREILAERFGFDGEDFWKFTKKNIEKSYLGKLDALDFFGNLAKELGLDVSAEEMVEGWKEARRDTTLVDKDVVDLIGQLKGLGIVVGSLTDTTKLNDVVRDELGVYDLFDFVLKSTEVGVRKPDKKMYEELLRVLGERGIEADEVLFVDDVVENLEGAMKFGIRTALFEGFEGLERKLIENGVEV